MRRLRALALMATVALAGQAAVSRANTPTTYKARRGDTLSSIAKRYHTTVAALADANSLADPNRIRAGQVLSLVPKPKPAPQPAAATQPAKPTTSAGGTPMSDAVVVLAGNGTSTYQVVKGDNLSKIATRFNTTVADLAKTNNLKIEKPLRIGVELIVPGSKWTCPVQGPHDFADSWRQPRAGGKQHMGTDVFAAKGTPVVAPVDGTVRLVQGAVGGLAFYVTGVDGVTYYGAHMTAYTVSNGAVKAGQQLGTVGNTGDAAGGATHLHFEIHPNGVAVDPFPTLKRWC